MATSKIDNIIAEIKQSTGIIRKQRLIVKPEVALRTFKRIGDAMLEWQGREFDIEPVKEEARMLINWTYMLDSSLDYTKGILLKGRTGVGKTFLMKVWCQFLKIDRPTFVSNGSSYVLAPTLANTRTIAALYAESQCGGNDVIRQYSSMPCLILDDIGAEPQTQSSFGNKVNVIAEIIDRRNDAALLTFGTTNLHKMTDNGCYDDRTARRMSELFNVRAVRKGYGRDTESEQRRQ